jgi:hypothetical protein
VGDYAQEINSVTNTSYLTLDEHLVIFFCHQTLLSQDFITYEEIQINLINFLYSLKYYCKRWVRAKTYAILLGFLKEYPSKW